MFLSNNYVLLSIFITRHYLSQHIKLKRTLSSGATYTLFLEQYYFPVDVKCSRVMDCGLAVNIARGEEKAAPIQEAGGGRALGKGETGGGWVGGDSREEPGEEERTSPAPGGDGHC